MLLDIWWRQETFCSQDMDIGTGWVPPCKLLSGQRVLCSQDTQQDSEAVFLPPFKIEWSYVATPPYAFKAYIVTGLAFPLSSGENVCCE